jgi:hypothetical protein
MLGQCRADRKRKAKEKQCNTRNDHHSLSTCGRKRQSAMLDQRFAAYRHAPVMAMNERKRLTLIFAQPSDLGHPRHNVIAHNLTDKRLNFTAELRNFLD